MIIITIAIIIITTTTTILIIVILIVIDSYILIKHKDHDNGDENNTQNKDNKIYINKKKSPYEWSFLTITIIIATNITLTATYKTVWHRLTMVAVGQGM